MSEEKKDVNSQTNENVSEEKQSTKTFTQSDFDSALARETGKIEDKYKDFGTMSERLEALEKEKKEKDLASKSEVERLTIEKQDIQKNLESIVNENNTYKLKEIRNNILLKSEYSTLPRAYKNMVKLDENADLVKQSADDILKEYQTDMGKGKESFGTPLQPGTGNIQQPKNMAEIIKQKLANRGLKKTII